MARFPAHLKVGIGMSILSASLLLIWVGSPQSRTRSPPSMPAPIQNYPPSVISAAVPAGDAPETLPQLARLALEHYFATRDLLPPPDPMPTDWRRSTGVFVTLSHQGQTRGCWGTLVSVAPDLAQATIRAAIGAATRDPRYPPLRASELQEISIQVALVEQVHPIQSPTEIDPTRSGLFVRSGSQGGVLLPGEALTSEWQMATARRWAQIPQSSPVEVFRVEAQLLHEF